MSDERPFWERPEQVERFADREPDHRLLELLWGYADPTATRVLDLGCAGGRNTVVLAERGFDFFALDISRAMVERTRERVAGIVGREEAARRVFVGRMGDLSAIESGTVDLVLALGVYHNAGSREQWDRALAETARVLRPASRVLVSNFSPRSDPAGRGLREVPGKPHVYEGFDAGPLYLLGAEELDDEMARHGLLRAAVTETVSVPTDTGRRVTVNGLYYKEAD